MSTEDPRTSFADPQHIKRDYIESSLLLVESFAKQAECALEQGDELGAQRARAYVERFRNEVLQIIDTLQNPAEAEAYRGRLEVCSRGARE
jgi:hypothetical protein